MEVFCKNGVLRNFANFTGKHRCVPVNSAKFLTTPFLTENTSMDASMYLRRERLIIESLDN